MRWRGDPMVGEGGKVPQSLGISCETAGFFQNSRRS